MSHTAGIKKIDDTFGASSMGGLDQDPVLARVEMALASSGSEISNIVQAGASVGAHTGGQIMNALAMLMVQAPRGGTTTVTPPAPSSAGPLIAAGAAGIAAGAGVAGALARSGSKPTAAKPVPAPTGTVQAGPAASADPSTPPVDSSAPKTMTPPPGGSDKIPEPPTKAQPGPEKYSGFEEAELGKGTTIVLGTGPGKPKAPVVPAAPTTYKTPPTLFGIPLTGTSPASGTVLVPPKPYKF